MQSPYDAAEPTTAPATPPRTRRWRRIVTRRPAAVPAAAPAEPAPEATAVEARHPGFVAVAIARVLIAIDFALRPGRRD